MPESQLLDSLSVFDSAFYLKIIKLASWCHSGKSESNLAQKTNCLGEVQTLIIEGWLHLPQFEKWLDWALLGVGLVQAQFLFRLFKHWVDYLFIHLFILYPEEAKSNNEFILVEQIICAATVYM